MPWAGEREPATERMDAVIRREWRGEKERALAWPAPVWASAWALASALGAWLGAWALASTLEALLVAWVLAWSLA